MNLYLAATFERSDKYESVRRINIYLLRLLYLSLRSNVAARFKFMCSPVYVRMSAETANA